jgi:hypothetical protein
VIVKKMKRREADLKWTSVLWMAEDCEIAEEEQNVIFGGEICADRSVRASACFQG